MASPRLVLWLSVVVAALSFPANGLLMLYSWAALAWVVSPFFADTHTWLIFPLAFVAHLALFLALAAILWALSTRRSPRFRQYLVLGGAVVYSLGIVVAFIMYVGPALSRL